MCVLVYAYIYLQIAKVCLSFFNIIDVLQKYILILGCMVFVRIWTCIGEKVLTVHTDWLSDVRDCNYLNYYNFYLDWIWIIHYYNSSRSMWLGNYDCWRYSCNTNDQSCIHLDWLSRYIWSFLFVVAFRMLMCQFTLEMVIKFVAYLVMRHAIHLFIRSHFFLMIRKTSMGSRVFRNWSRILLKIRSIYTTSLSLERAGYEKASELWPDKSS